MDGEVAKSQFRVMIPNTMVPLQPLPLFTNDEIKKYSLASGQPQPTPEPEQTDDEYKRLKQVRKPGGLREMVESKLEQTGVRPGEGGTRGNDESRGGHVGGVA